MKIEFLYYEDCPSHDEALERLQGVMDEFKLDTPIEIVKVETDEQAVADHFIGSPTIRINGEDIAPPANEAEVYYSLTCRAYRLENGRISPLPSEEMIRQTFRRFIAIH
ncbi:MAG: DUF2703 domain-containing protein [Anaerolineae bacterium]|nr:DUF2703 domain-containing protein [Anaerolineae bacterium]